MRVEKKGKEKIMDQLHYEQPMNGGNAMVILPSSLFLHRRTSEVQNKVQVDVPEPILTLADKSSDEYSKTFLKFPFECKEVYPNSHGYETRHVNPESELSYPVSSRPIACNSSKALFESVCHQHQQRNVHHVKLRNIRVGKVRVQFPRSVDNNNPDRLFHISKGGIRIHTTVTSNPSTVVAFIRFVWKKYLNYDKWRVVGLDCEYTRYVNSKERKKLPIEQQVALSIQEPQRAAVLQLCVGKHCLIYQLYQADGWSFIPPLLRIFLENDTIEFAGAAIGNDIKKLKFYNLGIRKPIDVQGLGIKVPNQKEGDLVSLEKLAKKVAKISLNKDKSITLSQWEKSNLDHDQIKYACLDAYASFEVYRRHSNIAGYLRTH
ncbi:werner syndrome-like exonuclease [Hordeum vulgare]|nr:werner syndrome-like exonuclease [Hordeum vulgare]